MTDHPSSPVRLDHYRKQAKQLVRDVRAGEGGALERIRPQLRHIVSLADAQLVIAREQGFQSWASFRESAVRSGRVPAELSALRSQGGPALLQLAELLAPAPDAQDEPDSFVSARGGCERLRAALQRDERAVAAGDASFIEWALKEIAREATGVVADRAVRALELLERAVREEALDLATVRCSFCLKDNHVVAKLIRGSQGYICDVCIDAAVRILEANEKKQG